MNLFDFVKRKDRGLEILVGDCQAEITFHEGVARRCVQFADNSKVILKKAHDFFVFKTKPNCFFWQVRLRPQRSFLKKQSGKFRLLALSKGKEFVLAEIKLHQGLNSFVEVSWPALLFEYDLIIETEGPVELDVGANASARKQLLQLIRGYGIEIGPGLNPAVRPNSDVKVEYIEAMPIEKWGEVYKLEPGNLAELERQGIIQLYRLGNASSIEEIYANHTLDFIFTNHVFEHLINPFRILEIWSNKLKKGGKVLGIVPDFRYCFDLRQSPSLESEWLSEYQKDGFEVENYKLERWIRNTSPSSDFEALEARNYSVHVHFYTPERFLVLANYLIERQLFSSVHIESAANNKDFGFVLLK